MKWSDETLLRNIEGTKRAILGTNIRVMFLTRPVEIEAHESYLKMLKKNLAAYEAEWTKRRNP